ncbi:MAG: fibronectin type III domain-containing protein [Dehalococcoidales bacterium]|nr:fibronectin type III domain-containing protein [Dehalococcoidales bacterium]
MATKTTDRKEKENGDMPVLFIFGIGLSGLIYFLTRKKAEAGGISITINGALDEDGGAETKVSFEYSGPEEIWTESPRITAVAGTEFSLILPNLVPDSTYYFRARAENEAGIVFGETLTVQT